MLIPWTTIPCTTWKASKYGVLSGQYFSVFRLNMKVHGVNPRIQSEYRKIQTRKKSVFWDFSRSDDPFSYVKKFQWNKFQIRRKPFLRSSRGIFLTLLACFLFSKGYSVVFFFLGNLLSPYFTNLAFYQWATHIKGSVILHLLKLASAGLVWKVPCCLLTFFHLCLT